MEKPTEFKFFVHVDADEWAYAQRRVTYLEALLIRVLHDKSQIKEWYEASELAALRLPSLPVSASGITRKAVAQHWFRKKANGNKYTYYFGSLPERAFDALIGKLLTLPKDAEPARGLPELEPVPVPIKTVLPDNAAPVWILPLMRLLKGKAKGNLTAAWTNLPDHLPAGTTLPDVDEATDTLIRLGLV